MRRTSLPLVAVVLLAAGCGGGSTPSPAASRSTTLPPAVASASSSPATSASVAAGPCRGAPAPARWHHVVWIWLENKELGQVIGSRSAPYLTGLASSCGLATDYHGVAHPSLPNYLASISGTTGSVDSDCSPSDCPQHRPTLFDQLGANGWRTYAEAMPSPCDRVSSGRYAPKHNPAVYFPALRPTCLHADVALQPAFPQALGTGNLPAFVLVVPDLCHDMHDCSVATGDRWLSQWVPRLLASPAYRSGQTVLVITFDEGYGSENHVATVVVSPSTAPGTRSSARYDHYSLLATTEDILALPRLGRARGAASFAPAFGLRP